MAFHPNENQPLIMSNSKTLVAANTTAAVPIFRISGMVNVKAIWGVVTTAIGSNHTGAYLRLNDQTSPKNITLNTGGATLSSLGVGSIVMKNDLATAVAQVHSSAAGVVDEPVYPGSTTDSEFHLVAKATANTDIEYVYTTTNNPTTGAIQFFIEYFPRSIGASVSAL